MGFRSVLKRSLRLGLNRSQRSWERMIGPIQARRNRDRLRPRRELRIFCPHLFFNTPGRFHTLFEPSPTHATFSLFT